MARKFIPDSDRGFAQMARNFSDGVSSSPERYFLSQGDAEIISRAVTEFRHRLALATWPRTRTTQAIREKDAARARAERIVRKYGALIRANTEIDSTAKMSVEMREQPRRARRRPCPQKGPYLRHVRSEGGAHVIEFREQIGTRSRAKPRGAARLELFIEMIEPGRPIPRLPGERPWYLRSFTSSPMRVEFPLPDGPRMIVYWGRWADATGEVGPWSDRCDARVEGWSAAAADTGSGEAAMRAA